MRLILAPQYDVKLDDRQHRDVPAAELDKLPSVEVPDDSDQFLKEAVASAISAHPEVIGADPQVDAPPYAPETWWLAVIERAADPVRVYSFPPTHFYGIDAQGRIRFAPAKELRVSDFVRAVDDGLYPTTEPTLIVTRAGEFGGNGFHVASVIFWLLEQFPNVLLGSTIDRAVLRHDQQRREQIELLAADWAARRIAYPRELRAFIQTREVWFPSALAKRLATSDSAARRLLQTLGYEPGEDDLMQFTGSAEGLAAQKAWEDAERTAEGYASIDELLDGRQSQPKPPRSGVLSRLRQIGRRN